jgi:ABC-type sugar transport system permease subunit
MKKKRFSFGLETRRELKGALFCLPWIIGFLAFFLSPLASSFLYSLYNIKFTATGTRMVYKGFDNYIYALLKDSTFINQLTSFWSNTVLSLIFILVFALALALLLQEMQQSRTRAFFRTLYFLPVVLTSGPVLKRLISIGSTQISTVAGISVTGLIEYYVPASVSTPFIYFFEQLVILLWYSGVPLLVFMTALQKIDRNQFDAARIDGASKWVVFWKIIIPAIRQIIMINAFYTLIFLATSEMNDIITTIKNAMTGSNGYGMACAMAWIYSLTILLALGVVALLCRERKAAHIEVYMTREQMRVSKLHQARLEGREQSR